MIQQVPKLLLGLWEPRKISCQNPSILDFFVNIFYLNILQCQYIEKYSCYTYGLSQKGMLYVHLHESHTLKNMDFITGRTGSIACLSRSPAISCLRLCFPCAYDLPNHNLKIQAEIFDSDYLPQAEYFWKV